MSTWDSFQVLLHQTETKQSEGSSAYFQDTPKSKTGDAPLRQLLSLYPSKLANNIYSRKFGPTVDESDGSHGGGRSESAAPKKRLRTCNPNFVQPNKDEPKNHDDIDDENRDDEHRDDDHDNDDKESEKTLILGAD